MTSRAEIISCRSTENYYFDFWSYFSKVFFSVFISLCSMFNIFRLWIFVKKRKCNLILALAKPRNIRNIFWDLIVWNTSWYVYQWWHGGMKCNKLGISRNILFHYQPLAYLVFTHMNPRLVMCCQWLPMNFLRRKRFKWHWSKRLIGS